MRNETAACNHISSTCLQRDRAPEQDLILKCFDEGEDGSHTLIGANSVIHGSAWGFCSRWSREGHIIFISWNNYHGIRVSLIVGNCSVIILIAYPTISYSHDILVGLSHWLLCTKVNLARIVTNQQPRIGWVQILGHRNKPRGEIKLKIQFHELHEKAAIHHPHFVCERALFLRFALLVQCHFRGWQVRAGPALLRRSVVHFKECSCSCVCCVRACVHECVLWWNTRSSLTDK